MTSTKKGPRRRYFVQHARTGWLVKRQEPGMRGTQNEGTYRTQRDAWEAACILAEASVQAGVFAQVILKGRDGKFRRERTFPRSSDPFPPKG